jgi:hypothetical protein
MKARLALLTLLAAGVAQAELKLYLWANGTETLVGTQLYIGTAPTGDMLEVRFRVRNTGPESVTVTTLSAKGSGFSLYGPPDLPYVIASGGFLNIFVRYQPTIVGTYSAVLTVNWTQVLLVADAKPATVLQVDGTTLTNGATIDWGSIEMGKSLSRTMTLRNLTSTAVLVNTVKVQGEAFQLAAPLLLPLLVESGGVATFDVVFSPTVDGAQAGSLQVDERAYELRGTGLIPALPQPELAPESTTAGSAQQLKLRVKLLATARSSGSGTVTMQFKPATGLSDDPAVIFASGGRNQTVTVTTGESLARFSGADSMTFQTGTTAGQIVFTVTLGGFTSQATVTVAPAVIGVDRVVATRESARVVVQVFGYDNTRTAGQLAFTFYDSTGRFLGAGTLRVDASADFQHFYQAPPLGGAFSLLAAFPVSGNVSTIASVDVALTNTVGTTAAPRAQF